MKKSLALLGCLAIVAMPLCSTAQAQNTPRDRQSMNDGYMGNAIDATYVAPTPANPVAYNGDTLARNRGENATGANMGPAGRNSGFDDNDALHNTSSRHINRTYIDGSDNFNARGTYNDGNAQY